MNRLPERISLHTDAAGSPPPDAFGPFRVLHQIGAGTLGPVFRAYEPDRDRLVAIKVFRLDLPPERVHRLVAEFERLIAAQLTHPGIAAPLAAGIENNAAYLVQEFVAADSLDIVIRDHGLAPPADALRLAVQLAGALDFASAVDVEHGALHPRDVLLSPDDTRMTGLGVGRALEGVGVPTPVRRPYTAPERMGAGGWNRRADIFSLAALLHELLWGRRIAATGQQAADGLTEIAGADLAALQAAFARALAEEPADRFETALDFAAALKGALPEVASRQSRVARPSEPLLPLDMPEPELRAAEEARFQDVEEAPARVRDMIEPPTIDADLGPPIPVQPPGFLSVAAPDPISVLERSRSAMWPYVLALLVGVALGFGAGYGIGYGIGSRDHTAALTPVAPGGREFTDAAIPDTSKPTPSPTPAAPAPAPSPQPPATSRAPEASVLGRLSVKTTPPGARVFVDGRDRGRTPASIRDVSRGSHRVRLVHEGYATEERRVTINASHPAQTMTVALTRTRQADAAAKGRASSSALAGSLSVDSRPPGAKVFIDGKLAGATPVVVQQIGAGEHAVRLEHDGYRPWSSSVRIVSGERNRVTASLEK
jgi:Protein kinase domain/PEGA domain